MLAATEPDLASVNNRLEGLDPQQILRWAVETYHPRLTMATAFGAEGCCLIAMLADIDPGVHIFNLETGYQFPETLDLRDQIQARYGIDVELVKADESVSAMEKRFGGPIYNVRPDECCRIRKIEPLKKALAGRDAWISAIRRDQTPDRAKAGIVEWDRSFGIVKVNPLANWSKREVWRFIVQNDVPYNPLHDQGYPSIGCWPCTKPAITGQHDRSGRWVGFAKLECGLHSR